MQRTVYKVLKGMKEQKEDAGELEKLRRQKGNIQRPETLSPLGWRPQAHTHQRTGCAITVKLVPLPLSRSHCSCLVPSPISQFPTSISYLQNLRGDQQAKET